MDNREFAMALTQGGAVCWLMGAALLLHSTLLDAGSLVNPMSIELGTSHSAGDYTLTWLGKPALASAPIGINTASGWCDAASGCLKLAKTIATTGSDALGSYNRSALHWTGPPPLTLETSFRTYSDRPIVVFEAEFPSGIPESAIKLESLDNGTEVRISPQTAFPAWKSGAGPDALLLGAGDKEGLASLSWQDLGNGFAGTWRSGDANATNHPPEREKGFAGTYEPGFRAPSAFTGGWKCDRGVSAEAPYGGSCSFPGTQLALFDQEQKTVLLMSALTNFDSVIVRRVEPSFSAGQGVDYQQLRSGVMGAIRAIPAGHKYETVIYGGQHGINRAYEGWGAALLVRHAKQRTSYKANLAISHLGFSTTAFYFYHTEGAYREPDKPLTVGKNYEETMIDVYDDAVKNELPYRYALLDSHWYGEYAHNGSGMYSWDESSAMEPDELNPGGRYPSGLAALSQRMGGRGGMGNFVQHMGKWRSDTLYAASDNAAWDWQVHERGGSPNASLSAAWTASTAFYDSLYGNATAWGLIAAKHDHVAENVALVTEAVEELGYLGRVLTAEHDGLAVHGASLMGGGYTMIGWLHSVQLPGVTHARVSDDYACWTNASTGVGVGCERGMNDNYWNFNVGPPSMLSWSLGVLPYKDSFMSNSTVKGASGCISCLYTNWSEPYPWVHAAVSALSAGPTAPGDKIGTSNRSLIMRTCAADGTLLKPDRPATPLDSYWSVRAYGANADGPQGEVWSTETTVSGSKWLYAIGTMLARPYSLTLKELLAASSAWPANYASNHQASAATKTPPGSGYVVYDFWAGPATAVEITDANPLVFPAGIDYGAARYFVAAPVLENGWAVLGEAAKFVAVARQRFLEVAVATDGKGVRVRMIGSVGEQIEIWARDPSGAVTKHVCTFGVSAAATLSLPSGMCAA